MPKYIHFLVTTALRSMCVIHFNSPRLSFLTGPLPNDKILELTKMKAFADNKLNVAYMTISLFDRVKNTVGNGDHTGYQHFLLFQQCF